MWYCWSCCFRFYSCIFGFILSCFCGKIMTFMKQILMEYKPSDISFSLTSSGGVVLASRDGKIVCENTLDARLDVVFRKKLPEVFTLFCSLFFPLGFIYPIISLLNMPSFFFLACCFHPMQAYLLVFDLNDTNSVYVWPFFFNHVHIISPLQIRKRLFGQVAVWWAGLFTYCFACSLLFKEWSWTIALYRPVACLRNFLFSCHP